MSAGMSVAMSASTNDEDQDRSLTPKTKTPDLTSWQSFRLTSAEKQNLKLAAQEEGVSVSTLLRRYIASVS